MKRALLLAPLLAFAAATANAAKLDISTEYRIRALTYTNLNLDPDTKNGRSFLSQSARLGLAFKDITLSDHKAESETMDVILQLRAIGVAGSTAPFNPPFNAIANQYPNTAFLPFFENALIRAKNLGGKSWTLSAGRQSYRQGSGLLLDDNGAGLTGFHAETLVPWGEFKAEAFAFQARNSQGTPNNLDLAGLSLEKRGVDGIWQWHHLYERDRSEQFFPVNACDAAAPAPQYAGCRVSKVSNYFTSVRYKMRFKSILFDGEVALQKGAATPSGPAPLSNHITTTANAQVVRAKWKQTFYKDIQGITRLVLARGSGDDPGTTSTNEAFAPSHGMRYDGLERAGFGQFYASTPYDAFGGQSTATASGLQRGASGIITVGFGVTPPSYKGWVLDLDYFLYQTERNTQAGRTLGSEIDATLRYSFRERFQAHITAAFFRSGPATSQAKTSARRYMLEIIGRF